MGPVWHRSWLRARRLRLARAKFVLGCLLVATTAFGQPAPDEHAKHHPAPPQAAGAMAPAAAASAPAAGAVAPAPAAMAPANGASAGTAAPAMAGMGGAAPGAAAAGGMGGGMAAMMGAMMSPPPLGAGAPPAAGCMGGNCGPGSAALPLYPSLMTLPSLPPEKRAEIEALASQQIGEGLARLAKGSESLSSATQAADNPAMQQAALAMREGLDELEAGIAARRVLAEGKAPRNLALDWFKREMNLASPIAREEDHALGGLTAFHLFTMLLLVGFALAMVAMYFFKMRRAQALFGRLEGDAAKPPPGSAPPLAGAPPPAAPAPPPAAPPAAASPAATAVSAPSPRGSAPPGASANWRGLLRVGSIAAETPNVKTFRLLPSGGGPLPFTFVPGQFLNVAFWIGGARMNRSYSISSSPSREDSLDLTVRREPRGAVSRHLLDVLKVGDQIEAGGPVGRFTFTGKEADSIVLLSGGVGITPMMSITRYLTERSWPGEIFFVYVCRTPADFVFRAELAVLQGLNPRLHVAVTMTGAEGTSWSGPRGRLTKGLLSETIPRLATRRVHLCGPPAMMESAKALLSELGLPPEQLKTEAFGATKPTPPAPGAAAPAPSPPSGPLVTFSKNNKASKIHTGQTVLELSEELGIGIENSCRVGTCGVCKVKMTSGEVAMAVEDALSAEEKASGVILACQAKPTGDIAVEA